MHRILVLCDDYWHPAEVIEKGLASLCADDYRFDIVRNPEVILTPEMLCQYPVIMNCKGNQLSAANVNPWFNQGVTEVGPAELRRYVENGGCLLAVHSGVSFSDLRSPKLEERYLQPCRDYINLVGCRFIGHPPRCNIQIDIQDPAHPVMQGVEPFVIRDEHYALDMVDKDVHLLFETVSESGGRQVGGYVKNMGQGKLCVLTPGHILSAWQHPGFQHMLLNTLAWGCQSAKEA